jgi:hypothetical protein
MPQTAVPDAPRPPSEMPAIQIDEKPAACAGATTSMRSRSRMARSL